MNSFTERPKPSQSGRPPAFPRQEQGIIDGSSRTRGPQHHTYHQQQTTSPRASFSDDRKAKQRPLLPAPARPDLQVMRSILQPGRQGDSGFPLQWVVKHEIRPAFGILGQTVGRLPVYRHVKESPKASPAHFEVYAGAIEFQTGYVSFLTDIGSLSAHAPLAVVVVESGIVGGVMTGIRDLILSTHRHQGLVQLSWLLFPIKQSKTGSWIVRIVRWEKLGQTNGREPGPLDAGTSDGIQSTFSL